MWRIGTTFSVRCLCLASGLMAACGTSKNDAGRESDSGDAGRGGGSSGASSGAGVGQGGALGGRGNAGSSGDAARGGDGSGTAGTGDSGAAGEGAGGGSASDFEPCMVLGLTSVRDMIYLRDGSAVVAGLAGGVAKIVDPLDNRELRTFFGHLGGVNALAITTDGGTLVTASDDHTVRLWRIADARSIRTLMGHEQGLLAVAISPDDSKIAAGAADGEVLLWNATDGALAASTVGHSGEVRGIGFAAGGERIWTASQDGSVRVWSADDLSPLATPMENNEPFVALAVSPDGARVVTSDLYGGLRVWRALEATSERRLEDYGGSHLEFDPTGTLLYSEGTSSVTIVPIDGSQISFLTSPIGDGTLTAAVSPRGDAVFAASGWLTVLFHPGGNQLREPIQQGPIALDAAFSPDGTRLAIGGGFGVAVRSLDTGNVLAAPDHSQSSWHVGGVAFSPDGSKLATGDGSGRLRLWSTTSWQVESAIEEVLDGAATQSIDEVRFSPDGTLLLGTGNVDHDTVYRVTPLEQITSLGLTGACNAGAFSPDGSMVAAANSVGDIVVRRTSDFGEVLRARFPSGGVQSVAFTSDGRFLVSTGYFHVTAWDLVNGAPPNDLLASNDYFGGAVAVSPDGGLLVAGGDDGRLLRWSLPDFTPLPDLPSHRQAVVSARFSSDGRRLAVGHRDGTVWLWCH